MTASCGACSACCYLLAVPDIDKPTCLWCQHAERPHGGCKIYDQPEKPQACDDFACLWLVSQNRRPEERMLPAIRPDRSKVMFHDARDGDKPNVMYVHVFPSHPTAWRSPAILDHINMVVDRGVEVQVIIGTRRIKLALGKEPETIDAN